MRKFAKGAVVLFAVVFGVLILFAGFYELHDFRPYLSRMNAVYDAMEPGDRQPTTGVQDFIWQVEERNVDRFAAGKLLGEIKGEQRMLEWHYHSLMWELMLPLHFGKAKRLAFYCHYLPYENGVGFSGAPQFYFGKQPAMLTPEEIAEIVAISRAPHANSPTKHPERLQAVKETLLEDYARAQ
jgi:Transglycosylase